MAFAAKMPECWVTARMLAILNPAQKLVTERNELMNKTAMFPLRSRERFVVFPASSESPLPAVDHPANLGKCKARKETGPLPDTEWHTETSEPFLGVLIYFR